MSGSNGRGIFLSYRREETSHVAGRLADRLAERFGADHIFIDVDSLEPGVEFPVAIRRAIDRCRVLLVLIGPQWSTMLDQEGQRRLDDPDDFVVLEVRAGLSDSETRVIPVLVDGAPMPVEEELPEAIAPLARRHAVRLDHESFQTDVAGLLDKVGDPQRRWAERLRRPGGALAAAALVVVALGAVALLLRPWEGDDDGWVAVPDLPEPLEAAAVAAHDGRLWVAGGVSAREGRRQLDAVHIYDPGGSAWREGPRLPQAVSHSALVSTGRQLFLIGGLSDTGSTDAVYRLDSPTGDWQADEPLPEPRGAGAAAWDGTGRILYAGGVGPDHRASASVWAHEGGGWRELGVLQRAREKLGAATDGFGTVWFLAGRDPNVAENAFPAVDVVIAETVRPGGAVAPVQGPAAVWWPDAGVCMLGGQTAEGFSAQVECLNEATGTPPPALTSGRAGLGAAVVNDVVYVVGGYDGNRHGSTTVERWGPASDG